MNQKITKLFNAGQYKSVVELWERRGDGHVLNSFSATLVVGALAFLGRRWDAEEFESKSLNEFGRNFFVGLAHTRESQYESAKSVFQKNLKKFKSEETDDLSAFFVWQGLGFFCSFTGDIKNLIVYAEKSYRAARRAKFEWGQVMALDLVAHANVLSGRIQEGLANFDTVIDRSKRMRGISLASSYEVSQRCYAAQVSVQPDETIIYLTDCEKNLRTQDTFSRNALRLEIFRQLIHKGEFSQARDYFSSQSPDFYKSKNRRHIATLFQRYAYLLSLQGHYVEALAVIRSARMNLNERVDNLQLLRSFGLEVRLLELLEAETSDSYRESHIKLAEIELKSPTFISTRIQKRLQRGLRNPFQKYHLGGQDPLGDLLDRVSLERVSALESMIKSKLFGLIPSVMGWDPKQGEILLDAFQHHALIGKGGVCRLSQKPIKGISRKLMECLKDKRPISKAELIRRVWGYKYESYRHDTLVQSAIHQLRLILGSSLVQIESTDEGYFLMANVNFLPATKVTTTIEPIYDGKLLLDDKLDEHQLNVFNLRQLSLMRTWDSGLVLNIRLYRNLFKVSHMTAFRDLKHLEEQNLIRRIGKGRSTCYIRSK